MVIIIPELKFEIFINCFNSYFKLILQRNKVDIT